MKYFKAILFLLISFNVCSQNDLSITLLEGNDSSIIEISTGNNWNIFEENIMIISNNNIYVIDDAKYYLHEENTYRLNLGVYDFLQDGFGSILIVPVKKNEGTVDMKYLVNIIPPGIKKESFKFDFREDSGKNVNYKYIRINSKKLILLENDNIFVKCNSKMDLNDLSKRYKISDTIKVEEDIYATIIPSVVDENNFRYINLYHYLVGSDYLIESNCKNALNLLNTFLELYLSGYEVSFNHLSVEASTSAIEKTSFLEENYNWTYENYLFDIGRIWKYISIFDFDDQTITAGVIDAGMRNSPDINFSGNNFNAAGDLTNLINEGIEENHGEAVSSILGAKLNNGIGSAGIAGQVASISSYDAAWNALSARRGINKLVSEGVSVINYSGMSSLCGLPLENGDIINLCNLFEAQELCSFVRRIIREEVDGVYNCDTGGFWGELLCSIPELLDDAVGVFIGGFTIPICTKTTIGYNVHEERVKMAVENAYDSGIPIIAAAGNVGSINNMNSILANYIDTSSSSRKLEIWDVKPANYPEVISVGALNEELRNAQIHGDNVDVWAPTGSLYYSTLTDSTQELRGTSGATPYITGLVALSQVVNPSLKPNPNDNIITNRSKVEKIRRLLRETSYKGPTNRRIDTLALRVVNPYEYLKSVGHNIVPDYSGKILDYGDIKRVGSNPENDNILNIDLTDGDNELVKGDIYFYPGLEGEADIIDVDSISVKFEEASLYSTFNSELRLNYLRGYGDLEVSDLRLSEIIPPSNDGLETIQKYNIPELYPSSAIGFSIQGKTKFDDNMYKCYMNVNQLKESLYPDKFEYNDEIRRSTVLLNSDGNTSLSLDDELNFHNNTDIDYFTINFSGDDDIESRNISIAKYVVTVHLESENSDLIKLKFFDSNRNLIKETNGGKIRRVILNTPQNIHFECTGDSIYVVRYKMIKITTKLRYPLSSADLSQLDESYVFDQLREAFPYNMQLGPKEDPLCINCLLEQGLELDFRKERGDMPIAETEEIHQVISLDEQSSLIIDSSSKYWSKRNFSVSIFNILDGSKSVKGRFKGRIFLLNNLDRGLYLLVIKRKRSRNGIDRLRINAHNRAE